MKQVVTISESARDHIGNLCGPGQAVLVRINNKGCSGHSYEYSMVDITSKGRFDELIEWDGGAILIDAASVMGLIGSTLDVKKSDFEHMLTWSNPQANNTCGCGTSFSL